MKQFTTGEAAHLIGLTPRQIRRFARSGVLSPDRGPGNIYLFSFRDLVLLRTAGGLLAARVPPARVVNALLRLRDQLPQGRALTEVHVRAYGDDVVVHDGTSPPWDPVTGQFVLDFAVAELAGRVASLDAHRAAAAGPGEGDAALWVQRGVDLEAEAPEAAMRAYERALALQPDHADAHVNLGRLLHEAGRAEEAAAHYRRAVSANRRHATGWFNLGVALEDLGRPTEAADAYVAAIAANSDLADAHYNLGRLYERVGDRRAALRHLRAYRELTERGSGGAR